LDRIGSGSVGVARGIPDPHGGPVVVCRDVSDGNVQLNLAAVQPIGLVHQDFPIAENVCDYSEVAKAKAPSPLQDQDRTHGRRAAPPIAPLGRSPPGPRIAPDRYSGGLARVRDAFQRGGRR